MCTVWFLLKRGLCEAPMCCVCCGVVMQPAGKCLLFHLHMLSGKCPGQGHLPECPLCLPSTESDPHGPGLHP